jgi:thiol-disulfide isomerase/thioredoxin
MTTKGITLYYADWCGHCKQFKPTWDAMKSTYGKEFDLVDFEHGKNPKIMKEKKIQSFPTIHFTYGEFSATYAGERDPYSIVSQYRSFVETTKNIMKESGKKMKGGSSRQALYQKKYQKYKQKYLKLKNEMK